MAAVWGADDVHRLIALFQSSEVLWWTNRKEYGKRGARFQALKKISVYINYSIRVITFCVSRRRRKMYCGHAHLCVCLSVRGRTPTLLHGLGCNLGAW